MKHKGKLYLKLMPNGELKGWKIITIRLSEADYDKMMVNFGNTTCRSLTEFGTKLFTGKPVTVYYRNRSYDEFIVAAIGLKKRLEETAASAVFSETDKGWLSDEIQGIKSYLSKIYDHVRQSSTRQEHP